MESVHKLETTVAGWYKNLPHLPKGAQKWLADNVWWIAAIGALLGALGLLALVPAVLVAFGVSAAFGDLGMMPGYGYGYGYGFGGFVWLSVLVSLASLALYTLLTGMAVSPLKDHKKKGWNLLFLVLLVDVATAVITLVLSLLGGVGAFVAGISGLISSLIGVAIGAYFLFEIRGLFGAVAKAEVKKPEAKKA